MWHGLIIAHLLSLALIVICISVVSTFWVVTLQLWISNHVDKKTYNKYAWPKHFVSCFMVHIVARLHIVAKYKAGKHIGTYAMCSEGHVSTATSALRTSPPITNFPNRNDPFTIYLELLESLKTRRAQLHKEWCTLSNSSSQLCARCTAHLNATSRCGTSAGGERITKESKREKLCSCYRILSNRSARWSCKNSLDWDSWGRKCFTCIVVDHKRIPSYLLANVVHEYFEKGSDTALETRTLDVALEFISSCGLYEYSRPSCISAGLWDSSPRRSKLSHPLLAHCTGDLFVNSSIAADLLNTSDSYCVLPTLLIEPGAPFMAMLSSPVFNWFPSD